MIRGFSHFQKLVTPVLRRTELSEVCALGPQSVSPLSKPLIVYTASYRSFVRHLVTRYHGCSTLSRETAKLSLAQNPAAGLATEVKDHRPWYDLNYDNLISLLKGKQIRIIDVRRRDETSSTGMMPGAINVPLDEIERALKMTEGDFAKLYGGEKPKQSDSDVVFSCLGGVRSRRALELAHKAGFSRVRHYIGGWEEYSRRRSS